MLKLAAGRNEEERALTTIFRAGRQLWKVRLWMWIALLLALPLLYYGWYLFGAYGLRPADGGVLAPYGQRLGWMIALWGMALILPAAMWAYSHCYVIRLDYNPANRTFEVRTAAPFSRHEIYSAAAVRVSTFHKGKRRAPNPGKATPWYFVYVHNRRWPLLVDVQGDFSDLQLAKQLFNVRNPRNGPIR